MVDEPGGFINLWFGPQDWANQTVQQEGMSGRVITVNQGKIVGGSSSINAMMYVRCNRRDYAAMTTRSGGDWTDADIDDAFARVENYIDGPAPGRQTGGMITVRDCPDPYGLSPEFQAAAVELGYRAGHDYNGPEQMGGAGPLQFNITEDGKRHSAARAYLFPILGHPLLQVRECTLARRVIFEGTRAVGIEVEGPDGAMTELRCSRDVVLALGALKTPELLLKSGVGPAATLAAAGVPVVADLPAVGRNLKDHVQLPVAFDGLASTIQDQAQRARCQMRCGRGDGQKGDAEPFPARWFTNRRKGPFG
jgi:choline dehydrogenase